MRFPRPAAAAILALFLASCATVPETPGDPSVAPSPTETLTIVVDLPHYESVEDLASAADAIVKARVISSRSDLDIPDYTSDDPRVNPYIGASETPSSEEIKAMGIPITVYTVEITESLAGKLSERSTIEVVEMGGLVDGIDHRVANLQPLATSKPDLLFLEQVRDGRYATVGMAQGRFTALSDGSYVSLSDTPLKIGTSSGLQRLEQVVDG